MALSASGRLVYSSALQGSSEIIWVDHSGRSLPWDPDWTIDADGALMALSPDERRIVVDYPGSTELRMKVLGGSYVRLPYDGGLPWWSPDGSEIIFTADTSAAASYDLWSASPDGIGEPRLLVDLDQPIAHGAREPGGGGVIFRTAGAAQSMAANVFRIATDGAMDTLLASETVRYFAPTLSPDGRFLAYVSTESGAGEVYVRTYPTLDRVWPISVGGGREPVWSPDGRRLYYKSLPDAATSRPAMLVSVPIAER